MEKMELCRTDGHVFVYFERQPDNAYILAHWIGRQTVETVMTGGTFFTKMLEEQPCSKLLNSHAELIGPWDRANDWIVSTWTPQVQSLGLRYLAQVLAPGIYGQMSFMDLHQKINKDFEIKMFDNEPTAQEWLTSLPNEIFFIDKLKKD